MTFIQTHRCVGGGVKGGGDAMGTVICFVHCKNFIYQKKPVLKM